MAIAAMLTAALKTPDDNSHEEIVWNALSLAGNRRGGFLRRAFRFLTPCANWKRLKRRVTGRCWGWFSRTPIAGF